MSPQIQTQLKVAASRPLLSLSPLFPLNSFQFTPFLISLLATFFAFSPSLSLPSCSVFRQLSDSFHSRVPSVASFRRLQRGERSERFAPYPTPVFKTYVFLFEIPAHIFRPPNHLLGKSYYDKIRRIRRKPNINSNSFTVNRIWRLVSERFVIVSRGFHSVQLGYEL